MFPVLLSRVSKMTPAEFLLMTADSDRETYETCMAIARRNDAETHDEEREGTWDHDQAALFHAEDEIKDHFEAVLDDMTFPGNDTKTCLAMSLMSFALGEINWREMAEHYLRKVAEGKAVQQ